MADTGGPARVKRMRAKRKKEGFIETNVSIPIHVRLAIERSVASGEYQTRRLAIIDALEKVFVQTERSAKSPRC